MNIDKEICLKKFCTSGVYYVIKNKETELLLTRYLEEKNIVPINIIKNVNYDYYNVVFAYNNITHSYNSYTFDKDFIFSLNIKDPSDSLQNYYNNQPNKELLNWIKL